MDLPTRQLVVDASVALAADSETEPCAEASRQFLQLMARGTLHVAVMTEVLEAEWRQRDKPGSPSAWALPWLLWMRRKSRVRDANEEVKTLPAGDSSLVSHIGRCGAPAAAIQAMLEDVHLLEAALVTDRTVISGDDKVRGHYGRASSDINALREISWVNPCVSAEEPAAWLRQGAPADPARKLSFHRK